MKCSTVSFDAHTFAYPCLCTQEWIADSEAVEEVQIMEEVPHSLRREIAYAVNRKIFAKLAVFHDFPVAEQMTIASMMTPLQVTLGGFG